MLRNATESKEFASSFSAFQIPVLFPFNYGSINIRSMLDGCFTSNAVQVLFLAGACCFVLKSLNDHAISENGKCLFPFVYNIHSSYSFFTFFRRFSVRNFTISFKRSAYWTFEFLVVFFQAVNPSCSTQQQRLRKDRGLSSFNLYKLVSDLVNYMLSFRD